VKTYKLKKQAKVQVIADATDPIANTITNYVNAILQNRAQEINKANLPAIKYKPKLNCITIRNLKCFTFVPGVMTVILMLVSAMMTSISITCEKNWVPWKYCSSPLKPLQVILEKYFPISSFP
jgi:ABC-2 type transport system permease protein